MTLLPILNAPLVVQIHIVAAVLALFLGPINIFRWVQGIWHRVVGGIWMVSMAVLAISGLMMSSWDLIWGFNLIHLFSLLTLWALSQSIWYLYRRNFRAHGRAMKSLYAQALLIAGLFTFLPGRTLSEVFFASAPMAGFAILAVLGTATVLVVRARSAKLG